MYNRYIPQPDGSFRRNTMEDKRSVSPPPKPDSPPQFSPPPGQAPPPNTNTGKPEGLLGFMKQLLPQNLDTADLLIILLILLMAGDCEENRNNALLTLALYFFM